MDDICYQILTSKELQSLPPKHDNAVVSELRNVADYNQTHNLPGNFAIAISKGKIVGGTGIEWEADSPYPIFSGTIILEEYQGKGICKPLVKHMLHNFIDVWYNKTGANSVIMSVWTKMESASFCYIKAALELNFTVNLYNEATKVVGNRIIGVRRDTFIFEDGSTKDIDDFSHTDVKRDKNGNKYYAGKIFDFDLLFTKPTAVGGAVGDDIPLALPGLKLRF